MRRQTFVTRFALILLVFIFSLSMPEMPCAAGVPSSAKSVNIGFVRHSFKAYNKAMTWKQAEAYCKKLGGHLATIATAPEQEILKSLGCSSKRKYWLGGSDAKKEGRWRWVTGERWSYTQWDKEQPSASGGSKDYLQLNVKGGYLWADAYANKKSGTGFICEWEEKLTDIGKTGISLSTNAYTCNGSAKKPSVKVTYGGKTLKKGQDYSLTYINNVNVGQAAVFVTGQGDYAGTVQKTYTIKPGKPKVTVKSSAEGTAVISWKKVKGAGGYRVEYKKKSDSSYNKVFTKSLSKKLTGLEAGTAYVFRVRAYEDVKGSRFYGSVSSAVTKNIYKKKTAQKSSDEKKAGALAMPMKGAVTGRTFGFYTVGMASTGRPYHSGVDLSASSDKGVYAAADGKVLCARYSGGNGLHIVLEHTLWGQQVYTLYSHLEIGSVKVSEGDLVKTGDKLGTMGSSGNVSAPHLHFGVYTMEDGASPTLDPWGYVEEKSGTYRLTKNNIIFYDPLYVIEKGQLPTE